MPGCWNPVPALRKLKSKPSSYKVTKQYKFTLNKKNGYV